MARIDVSLYAIIDPGVESECPLERFVKLIILGGVTAIQVRCKDVTDDEVLGFTRRVIQAVNPAGPGGETGSEPAGTVPVIVNDRLDVALSAGAAGVHLGPGDLPVREARSAAGEAGRPALIVGASTRTLRKAREAAEAGADYLGVGPAFATPNKPGVKPVEPGLYEAIKTGISLPIVAIGGINEENAHIPVSHGADGIAVISALRGTGDPRSAAARLRAAVERSREG